ncbi:2OG-Fe(II) oxygenase [Mangrovitalea sediminis]|uniref:2OG-Fe(II) oxygenase n=1 Tax=Mangrovitalea sediminis TaxID=1982043 RepID=UPI001D0CE8EA|nr:2OG-Fe(II) oxygenase [Mangrovitalea sediminis]
MLPAVDPVSPLSDVSSSLFEMSTLATIAEGLSSQGWCCVDQPFAAGADPVPELRAELLTYQRQDALVMAAVGRGDERISDRSIRGDRIRWLDGSSAIQASLFRGLDELQRFLNRALFLGLRAYEAHFALYRPGDFYRRHVDSFRGRASRIVSVVLYLNDEWGPEDGGALRLYDPNENSRILATLLPQGSRLMCFLSEDIPHEVLPATQTRYSIACWFRRDLPAA